MKRHDIDATKIVNAVAMMKFGYPRSVIAEADHAESRGEYGRHEQVIDVVPGVRGRLLEWRPIAYVGKMPSMEPGNRGAVLPRVVVVHPVRPTETPRRHDGAD